MSDRGRSRRRVSGPLACRGAEGLVVGEDAHLLVGDLVGIAGADGALGVAMDFDLREGGAEGVVEQEAPDGGLADVEDQLDYLGGLQQAHGAGQHAEDAVGSAGWRQLGGWRLAEEAAGAGALVGLEDGELAVEAEDGGGDDGDLQAYGGVVEQIAGGEVVDAVDDDVVALDDLHDVGGVDAGLVLDDVDIGVQSLDGLLRRVDLGNTDAVGGVDHLALQVGQVDDVIVDDAQRANAGGGEVERGGRAEAARSQQQHL